MEKMILLQNIEQWYQGLKKHKLEGVFSPHKIITILFALSAIYKNKKLINYKEDRTQLEDIITELTNKKANCLYPLKRLLSDNKEISIWKTEPAILPLNNSGDLSSKDALELNFQAGFNENVFDLFKDNKDILQKFIFDIIEDNFPETLHDYLIGVLELDTITPEVITNDSKQIIINKKHRDPKFPQKILALYDFRCAFCQLKIYYRSKPTSIEAAHIKWNAYGGECSEDNGIALCPTHHLTLDKGVWAIDQNYEIKLSVNALIDDKSDILFKQFIGKSILTNIINKNLKPLESNINWHLKNIFDSEE